MCACLALLADGGSVVPPGAAQGMSCALLLRLLVFSVRDKARGHAVFTSSADRGFAHLAGTVLGCGELAASLILDPLECRPVKSCIAH